MTTGSIAVSARAVGGDRASATAGALVNGISLFGGELTIVSASGRASARASSSGAGGTLSSSSLTGVTVLGQAVAPSPNERVALGDWGYAVLLEQAVQRRTGRRHGYRGFVTALHVHLASEHGGLPAGTDVMIGYADAAASAAKPRPHPTPGGSGGSGSPGSGSNPTQGPGSGSVPEPSPGGSSTPPVQTPPPGIKPELTAGGYVFPVYGPVSFSDDFGVPRADTVWHHGNDIFAPLGAPILAVADGTLFQVGWNTLGGNRLWLRDQKGNQFYYAHLSAYSPLAFEGSQVRAGDVIGFVGNTGDAATTPTHLHFEVHPRQLLWMGYDGVVDPYPFLLAWSQRRDQTLAGGAWASFPANAPPPGAVLLQADDISSASGLDPTAVEGALTVASLFGEGRILQPAAGQPRLVGAAAGFGGQAGRQ